MAVDMSAEEFERAVDQAIELIPSRLRELVDNCVIFIEDEPEPGEDVFGYYDGVPLSERGFDYTGVLPDRIMIFRQPHLEAADTNGDVIDEIVTTVVHEIAHHFGIEDDRLHELGWG